MNARNLISFPKVGSDLCGFIVTLSDDQLGLLLSQLIGYSSEFCTDERLKQIVGRTELTQITDPRVLDAFANLAAELADYSDQALEKGLGWDVYYERHYDYELLNAYWVSLQMSNPLLSVDRFLYHIWESVKRNDRLEEISNLILSNKLQ